MQRAARSCSAAPFPLSLSSLRTTRRKVVSSPLALAHGYRSFNSSLKWRPLQVKEVLAHEPHKIKTVRPVSFPTLEERKRYLAEAHFNVFNLITPTQVSFDMCSLGTSAMTQEQISGQLVGDEAYAGARSFHRLEAAVHKVLGHAYVCPAHNGLGCIKLIAATMVLPAAASSGGSVVVPSNAPSVLVDIFKPRNVEVLDIRSRQEDMEIISVFSGNVDLEQLKRVLNESSRGTAGDKKDVSVISLQTFAEGQHPFALENLRAVRNLADRHGKRLVVDGSRVIENAWMIQQHEAGMASRSVATIVKEIAKTAHIFHLDAAQDPKCPAGGLLATDNPQDYEYLMNEVVVYEGLHTYGGMAGRAMEVFARGLEEMCIESEVQWVMQQTMRFCERLQQAGVPIECGCDGAYILAKDFLPHHSSHQQDAFSAALYDISGVRALALEGKVDDSSTSDGRRLVVPVQVPRLAMTNRQLDQVADAIISLYQQRDQIPPLELQCAGSWRDQMQYRWVYSSNLQLFDFQTYPFVIHTVERIAHLGRQERRRAIAEAGYNTFLLRSEDVTIDLLTDSGTSAMSTDQWSAYDRARATCATSAEYLRLVQVLHEATGYEHIIPTHQGRAAEQILSEVMIKPGQFVPGNMYFTTTKLHQELAGGVFVDVIVDEAHDPRSDFPWKGNIDLQKLKSLVDEHGADKIAYISFEHSVNMAGGQPVSLQNMQDVYAYCSGQHIPVMFDATRMAENAYMIQDRDPNYQSTKIRDILREMLLYGDGATVSGKKDFLINIGGLLAFKDNAAWAEKSRDLLRIYEGSVTSGGLAASELAAIAVGVDEMLDDRYIRSRVRQTAALGVMLMQAGVPIVTPPGSHAIFLDAKAFLPHIDQDEYPAQRLACEIFVETGVRAMERGTVSKGRDPETGKNHHPSLELVRLTIPRRVYSHDHMRAVADGIIRLYEKRDQIRGLRIVYEPKKLRFFQGRFEPLEGQS